MMTFAVRGLYQREEGQTREAQLSRAGARSAVVAGE